MYKSFSDINDLKQWVKEDKLAKGMGASTLNRYPIRFILFDNFSDCYEFVEYLQSDCGAHVESVDKWIDNAYPDLMLTYVELGEHIYEHIRKKSPNDCVIAPFSELARFYDNIEDKTFDALLQTIKAIEATKPYNINYIKYNIIYIAIGLVLSCGLVFIMFYFDTTIKTSEEIEEKFGLTVLGVIPDEAKE